MTHLTPEQVEGWRARSLDPSQTLAAGDHLAQCAQCRARLQGAHTNAQAADAMMRESVPAPASAHLRGDELVALVDGTMPEMQWKVADDHLQGCTMCRTELEDLRRFAALQPVPRRRRLPMAAVAATLAIAATALILAVGPWSSPQSPAAIAPNTVVALHDAHGEVLLLDDDTTQGVPARFAVAAARLLRAPGRLSLPDSVRTVARLAETQRTAEPATAVVAILTPRSVVELDDRPLFRWSGPAEARYSVEIFDAEFNRLDASGPLATTRWQPSRPLPRDQLLTWKVDATIDGRTRAYPTPPEPPAVFRIASPSQVAAVDAARASGSHLLLGIALWDAGLVEAAAAEFALLNALNPDSPVAAELMRASRQQLVTSSDTDSPP